MSDFAYRWPPLVDDENAAQTGSVHAALLAVGVGMSFPCRQSPAAQKNHGGLWKYLQTLLTAVKPPRGLFRDSLGFLFRFRKTDIENTEQKFQLVYFPSRATRLQ